MSSTINQKFTNTFEEIEKTGVVKCEGCNTLIDSDRKDYLSIHGNICIGLDGGIVGNNFVEPQDFTKQSDKLGRISVFCGSCIPQLFKRIDKQLYNASILTRQSNIKPSDFL